MQTLTIAENSNAELKKKLAAEEQAQKSVDLALKGAERQDESHRKLVRKANDQLAASKEQVAILRKKLEEAQRLRDQAEKARAKAKKARVKAEKAKSEAERARDGAEQHNYDVGVAETEDALRAEVPSVCRAYCAQTWEEALNRVGIDAFSELRKSENVFFPLAIRVPGFVSSQKGVAPPVTQSAKDAQL